MAQCPERLRFLDRINDEQIGEYQFYSGHYYFDQIERIPDPKRVITILREPRARLLSLYYFFRAHTWAAINNYERAGADSPRLAKELDLRSYLHSPDLVPRIYTDNALVRHLIGLKHMGPSGNLLLDQDEAYDLAVQNLATMTAFGVLDHYSATRKSLESATGFNLPEVFPRENTWEQGVNTGYLEWIDRRNCFDEATEAAIAQSIALDKRVYDWAVNHIPAMAARAG